MRSRTLLERLSRSSATRASAREGSRPASAEEVLRASIARNLERLLNSRQDMSPACLDYGLSDLARFQHHDRAVNDDLERLIQTTIERFEPRLVRVRVRSRQDGQSPMSLRFSVEAWLAGSGECEGLNFDAAILPSGAATVV